MNFKSHINIWNNGKKLRERMGWERRKRRSEGQLFVLVMRTYNNAHQQIWGNRTNNEQGEYTIQKPAENIFKPES